MITTYENMIINIQTYPRGAYHINSYKRGNKLRIYIYDRKHTDRAVNILIVSIKPSEQQTTKQ